MPSSPTRTVTRQEVVFIDFPTTRTVQVSGQPFRVWTLYAFSDPETRPTLPYQPTHNYNAFLEDRIHDWMCSATGQLRYYSRVVDRPVWLLIEYAE